MAASPVGLRLKIVAVFGASLVLAWASVAVLAQAAYYIGRANRGGVVYAVLTSARAELGVANLAMLAGIALFVVYVFLLSRGGIRYLADVSRALQQVSLGNLDVEVTTRSPDELGELGTNVNRMTGRLKSALEEERRAEQAKNELIAGVSHDLRTPLTSILGYLELAAKPGAADPAEVRRNVQIALQKSRQLATLIDDLFEFTKVSDGRFEIRPAPIDLKELLTQLAEEYVPLLQANQMECRLTAREERYPVLADGDLMVRVFENLLSNAVRHGRVGRFVDVELSRDGDLTVARLINYGDPIPSEALPRVFDRFYRVDQSRSEKTGGAGLGLAIARRIVELHGGEISVLSDTRRTVFQVTLRARASVPAGA